MNDIHPIFKQTVDGWVKQTVYQRYVEGWVLISSAEKSVSHTVRFLNWDGTLLETVIVETDGGMAAYTGETPTKTRTITNYEVIQGYPAGANTNSTFTTPTGNGATAVYCQVTPGSTIRVSMTEKTTNRFRIGFAKAPLANGVALYHPFTADDTALEKTFTVPDGYTYMMVYLGVTPYPAVEPGFQIDETDENLVFIGWIPEPTNVTGDMDCVAQYKNVTHSARALLQRTISGAYVNNRVTKVGPYAFYKCTNLVSLEFANVTNIDGNAFNGCSKLETLILRSSTVCTLAATSAFTSTKIASGTGYIYVPSSLLADYQSATNWSTYASGFRAIEDYPEICGGK